MSLYLNIKSLLFFQPPMKMCAKTHTVTTTSCSQPIVSIRAHHPLTRAAANPPLVLTLAIPVADLLPSLMWTSHAAGPFTQYRPLRRVVVWSAGGILESILVVEQETPMRLRLTAIAIFFMNLGLAIGSIRRVYFS